MDIITYATHKEGTLDDLVNNKYGVPMKVLGLGTKWNGFTDKIKGVRDYCLTVEPSRVIVFLDGFDTVIHKDPSEVYDIFVNKNCKILFSNDRINNTNSLSPFRYWGKKVFGSCDSLGIVNSGMYMGYAGDLVDFLDRCLKDTSGDDQRDFNTVCKTCDNVGVDTHNEIFHNISSWNDLKTSNSPFCSYAGQITLKRIIRDFKNYSKFFIPEILLIILLSILLFVLYNRNTGTVRK